MPTNRWNHFQPLLLNLYLPTLLFAFICPNIEFSPEYLILQKSIYPSTPFVSPSVHAVRQEQLQHSNIQQTWKSKAQISH